MNDVVIRDEGTIVLFIPTSPKGTQWLEEHLDPECPRWGDGYAVEHRYAQDIIEGLLADEINLDYFSVA